MIFDNFIRACEEEDTVSISHFLCVSSNGILEQYCKSPYKIDSLKLFFSMTKSFASLAIGIAVDKQMLSLDDFIYTYFPESLPPNPHQNLFKIKIRHLLTMSCGIHDNTYNKLLIQHNWIEAFLKQEFPHEPGTFYRYSTHSSHMLSAIITKVSGLSLKDFLDIHLFYPMNIYEAQWEHSPEGLIAGGMGLSLYPISLAKVAQMLLNEGNYQGEQLISKAYLQQASSSNIVKQNDSMDENNTYCGWEYGFQFHIGKDGFYRADGAFGQLCLICPKKKLAFIAFSQSSKMEVLLKLIYQYFLDCKTDLYLSRRTSNIEKLIPTETTEDNIPPSIPCKKYRMEENILNIKYVELSSHTDCHFYTLKLTKDNTREDSIQFSLSSNTQGTTYFIKDLEEHQQEYICYASFSDLLELTIYFIETPYVVKYYISFNNETITLDFKINVSFTLHNTSINGHLLN